MRTTISYCSRQGRQKLTLLISRLCHLRVMASNCCSLLSIALATVSSTKFPMIDLEIASRGSFFDNSLDMNICLCLLSRNTMRKFLLSEKYSSKLWISFALPGRRSIRDITEEEHPLVTLYDLIVGPPSTLLIRRIQLD